MKTNADLKEGPGNILGLFSFNWLVIIWIGKEDSFEIAQIRSRGWKNFGCWWTRGVEGLENWTIFMGVICASSLHPYWTNKDHARRMHKIQFRNSLTRTQQNGYLSFIYQFWFLGGFLPGEIQEGINKCCLILFLFVQPGWIVTYDSGLISAQLTELTWLDNLSTFFLKFLKFLPRQFLGGIKKTKKNKTEIKIVKRGVGEIHTSNTSNIGVFRTLSNIFDATFLENY